MLTSLARGLSLIAIAVLAFAAWVHPVVLDPQNVGWLLRGQDIGQSALGLAAYLRVGEWPGTHHRLLLSPEGVTLLFTDSNPLLGLILWPVAPWFSPGLQFIGLWLLACLLLHVLFAWLLIRRVAPDFISAWLGTALLTLVPTLFNRIAHVNLCAHWLILWSFWIFVDRDRARSPGWWAAVLGVAALVHPYLLLMVAAIWGSAIMAALAERPDRPAAVRLLASHALVALMLIGLMAINGVFGQGFQSTGTFGAFPMAIDAIINPANPSYSALLPSTRDNGGRGFEGFQYLGAGLLLLLVATLPTMLAMRRQVNALPMLPRWRWLVPSLGAMAIFSLGNQLWLHGTPIMTIPIGKPLIDLLDPVRATGRFFWPLGYALALVAIGAACRLGERAKLLLAVALALQIIDITPMFAAIRKLSADAENASRYRRTPDPRWDQLIKAAGAIEFQPADNFADLQLLQEISWRAMLACRPTRFTYASRLSAAQQTRLEADKRAFAGGRIDATRLYVVFDPASVPVALRSRTQRLDGIVLLPATRRSQPALRCR